MASVAYDKLEQSSGSSVQGMTQITRSCIVSGITSIADAIAAVPLGATYGGLYLTNIQVASNLPDSQAARLLLTYTLNSGILITSSALKSEQWSYDQSGNTVKVKYTPAGGKTDSYTAQFQKLNPSTVFKFSRYETETADDTLLNNVNSDIFLDSPPSTVMFISCGGQMMAPSVYNNDYTFLYDPNGFNARVPYFNRWGKIPKNILVLGPPIIPPQNANGSTVVDEYKQTDFNTGFNWCNTLAGT